MTLLILGLIVFIGTHLIATARGFRAEFVLRMGEGAYKALFSVVSLIGVVMIAKGFGDYRQAGYIQVWDPPVWTRHLALLLMWPAMICLVAAYVPGEIKRRLKHPMLVAVKIWAFAHLLANGDLGSILLFGSFLAWGVLARIQAKRREAVEGAPVRSGPARNDVVALIIGLAVYVFMVGWGHSWLIGVPII